MTDWDATSLAPALAGLRDCSCSKVECQCGRSASTTSPFIDLDAEEPAGIFRCDHGTVFDRGEQGWELLEYTGCPCFRTEV